MINNKDQEFIFNFFCKICEYFCQNSSICSKTNKRFPEDLRNCPEHKWMIDEDCIPGDYSTGD